MRRIFGDPHEREIRVLREVVEDINALEPQMQALSNDELRAKTEAFRGRLAAGETLDDLLPEAFAAVREAAIRTLKMRHFDVQLIGGMVLHHGRIAEMKTGEGKTLVATLPLYLNALTGEGAHLVTPNDYLSKVGLQTMGPVYHLLGLTTSVIQNAAADPSRGSFLYDPTYQSDDERYQSLRPCTRQEAYAADITYGTNNEFGFDYLRDNMVRDPAEMVQRGHTFAIVDEVDNILIDEARTPLIISGMADAPSPLYGTFAQIVKKLVVSSADTVDRKDEEIEPDGDYILDQKTRTAYLTERGVDKVEAALKRQGLLKGDDLYHPDNADMIPYLDNSLRAKAVFERDKEYIVSDKGEVVIIDEFTGRQMVGRRFSEGLHQAIEAKEGVKIQNENLTLATVTFQNYFRMYNKLAGMTGTALTEADEFDQIYKLEVTPIPTHRMVQRQDKEDLIYMNRKAKWDAVVAEIKEAHGRGQPVLVGTIAIETSEHLSKLLTRAGVPHNILNAKQHEREAVIIAQAGRPGAVTIATNMAGRGVDILLGGNPEGLAREKLRRDGVEITEATPEQWDAALAEAKAQCEKDKQVVVAQGGLHVVGTERHEARRIDNQLRGRAGRQGDPGSSSFFLSLEDELMIRFGGDRVKGFMKWADMPEDQPIEHKLITSSIQQAQIRIEGYNFDIRKRVLEYDDVVNKQRQVIYSQRQEILETESLREQYEKMIAEEVDSLVNTYLPDATDKDREGWDADLLYREALALYPVPEHIDHEAWAHEKPEEIKVELLKGALEAYQAVEDKLGSELMRIAEKQIMLQVIDRLWVRHLTDLDDLREGIGMQAIAQRDPLVEYKREAFGMWEDLQAQIQEQVVQTIFRVEVTPTQPAAPVRAQPSLAAAANASNGQEAPRLSATATAAALKGGSSPRNIKTGFASTSSYAPQAAPVSDTPAQPIRADQWDKVGRNDPCPCGSGKKFKACHYPILQAQRQTVSKK
jgi:preprotein translocase subunit SecA